MRYGCFNKFEMGSCINQMRSSIGICAEIHDKTTHCTANRHITVVKQHDASLQSPVAHQSDTHIIRDAQVCDSRRSLLYTLLQ
jgi:hypothetical protein